MRLKLLAVSLTITLLNSSHALAWHDATHMAVMKAAGLANYSYLAVGADMAKENRAVTRTPTITATTPKVS